MPTTGNSIYVHIPFCGKKCNYCHFYTIPDRESFFDFYIEHILKEIALKKDLLKKQKSISLFFGGGTPSLLPHSYLGMIFESLSEYLLPNAEITIETNPENTTVENCYFWQMLGINRVSVGVQSFNDPLLKILGRTHDSSASIQAINRLYNAGIKNISIDIMYDIPNQSNNDWKDTLLTIQSLPITHVSLYNMTIEPHTSFYKQRDTISKLVPNENDSSEMLSTAISMLNDFNFKRYEISAFAKENHESVHNKGYWLGRPFVGLGPSAWSYIDGSRIQNIERMHKWGKLINCDVLPTAFEETLETQERELELLSIGLRLINGINKSFFTHKNTLEKIEFLKEKEWITIEGDIIKPTNLALNFHDSLAELII